MATAMAQPAETPGVDGGFMLSDNKSPKQSPVTKLLPSGHLAATSETNGASAQPALAETINRDRDHKYTNGAAMGDWQPQASITHLQNGISNIDTVERKENETTQLPWGHGSGARLTTIRSAEPLSPPADARLADDTMDSLGQTDSPTPGRRSVSFARDALKPDGTSSPQTRTPPSGMDAREQQGTKSASLRNRLRALQGNYMHTRSSSADVPNAIEEPLSKPAGAMSPQIEREGFNFPATSEEARHPTDADVEDSATDTDGKGQSSKRRRMMRRLNVDSAENSASSPRSLRPDMHHAQTAGLDGPRRPWPLHRSATDGENSPRKGNDTVSDDEGRRHKSPASPWQRTQESWRGMRSDRRAEGDPQTPGAEHRRPLNLRSRTHLSQSSRDIREGDATPRSKRMKVERGATLSAQKWRQLKAGLKMLGQKNKKERTIDYEKSAELMAELMAGSPAALIAASMFQRDEHGSKRIPILLEQLKVAITDSEFENFREEDDRTPGDRHMIFRIELEYGSGINRMKWVIKRSLRDFANLHVKYKTHYAAEKYLKRGTVDQPALPRFPKSAFPYLKSYRGFQYFVDEQEFDDPDERAIDNEGGATDNETRPAPLQRKTTLGLLRRKSSLGHDHSIASAVTRPGVVAGATVDRNKTFQERARKKLELYLNRMIKFMLFKADGNRLCKFLEVSALGMRLAAEGSYHGKEGFLAIQSAKGLDFRKTLTVANFRTRHRPKWFLVRHSYIVCVDSPEEMHIYDVFLFDSDFSIRPGKKKDAEHKARQIAQHAKENSKHPQHHRLKIQNAERKLKLLARNERTLLQFEDSIKSMVEISPWAKKNRFESFAPVRPNCFAQWLVDGRDHMWVVSRAINQAKDVIYIHDWWLSPELYMRRPAAISQKWRLDRLLKRKAEQGVKIFVIVYRNIESAVPIDSQYTKFSLLDLHPNVFVQRSPNQFRQNTFFWAHHEKICIIDHTLAFVGGIDLCFGRWDTPQHSVTDDKATGFEMRDMPKDADHCQLFPGKDYSNPRVQDFYALNKPYEEMYDRQNVPRMPWHDISMQIVGQPARDLTRHFVQRWNYILRQRKPTRPTPFLLPPPDFNPADLEALGLDGTCEVQILRSAGPWSLGTPDKTECSIQNAYCKMIEESDHFVYIENQFFITSCSTEQETIQNHLGDAIVERIIRAHENDETWHAIVVIPLLPGFQNTVDQEGGTSVRLIMQYQYRSICRGESSIFGRLQAKGIEPEDYIQFYSLRNWGKIGPQKQIVTEQLYIHAKCMVVDDRIAIIGSANINERSMLGNRDSEVAAVVRDTDMLWSRMNGEPYEVGRFPHTLRMRLMREHLGLDVDEIMEKAQDIEAELEREEARKQQEPERRRSRDDDSDLVSPVSGRQSDDGYGHGNNEEHQSGTELRDGLLKRLQDMHSFNHDVDWEQADNPNLITNRQKTQDPRVTKNETHAQEVRGFGEDNMINIEAAGFVVGRDSVLVNVDREVLTSAIDTENKGSLERPLQHGETRRNLSYIGKREAGDPPLPRPHVPRLNTSAMGLPMVSTLPELPAGDDTDIGGPPLTQPLAKSTSERYHETHIHHSLLSDLKRPYLDKDSMLDPIHESFVYDMWHQIAENNTKIYRSVFRCMPDNEVKEWHAYKQYQAYEHRFRELQGSTPPASRRGHHPDRADSIIADGKTSGPPGAGTAAFGVAGEVLHQLSAIGELPAEALGGVGKIKNRLISVVDPVQTAEEQEREQQKMRNWAAEANRAQRDRQNKRDSVWSNMEEEDIPATEKVPLASVPEQTTAHDFNEKDADANANAQGQTELSPAKTSNSDETTKFPTIAFDAKPPNRSGTVQTTATNTSASAAHSGSTKKRRRRATTRSSRREFSANDDLPSLDEADEMLSMVQGNLVIFPYHWLEKVEAGGNWLYPLDQITPIEIYV